MEPTERGIFLATFIQIVLLFFCYSFIGWAWETVYCSIKARKFQYRGFLIGPITPIYGFGILAVLYFLEPLHDNLLLLYVAATIIVTVLEYVTSFGLEKLFHASWWDYKDVPLNINGRVAVPVSLFWGVGCVLIVKILNPQVLHLEEWLASHFGFLLPVFLIALISFDLGYTLANMAAFQAAVKRLNATVDNRKEELKGAWETSKEDVQQRLNWGKYLGDHPEEASNLPRLNFNQRRLLKNFPHLRLSNVKNGQELRQLVEDLRKGFK